MQEITSPSNPHIKELVQLQKKASERRRTLCFVAEGERLVKDAVFWDCYLETVYVTRETYERLAGWLERIVPEQDLYLLSDAAMAKASDTKSPQGILAVAKQPIWCRSSLLEDDETGLFLILEDIQDPGNLGTIFRTAAAAGVDGIFLSEGCVDLFNPKTVRASMSSILEVPFIEGIGVQEAIDLVRGDDIGRVYAACPGKGSQAYDVPDYRWRTAFLIGNEANGLKEETIQAADQKIMIPMRGHIESLNAAMSSGILLYEAARQRRFGTECYSIFDLEEDEEEDS